MKILIAFFGVISYTVGMGGLVYFILYLGPFDLLPTHINTSPPGNLLPAILINLGVMILFGIQHTVCARPWFKEALTRILPAAAERSSYVLLSGVMMILICHLWQPIDGTLWQVSTTWATNTLIALYGLGWSIAVISSFLINHFDLFGLQQVYHNLRGTASPDDSFTERGFYSLVRHPLQLGILIGVWATPVMSMTHLMLAGTMTAYIFIGLYFEEKDLVRTLGPDYEDYQRRVRKVLPLPVKGSSRDKPLQI